MYRFRGIIIVLKDSNNDQRRKYNYSILINIGDISTEETFGNFPSGSYFS